MSGTPPPFFIVGAGRSGTTLLRLMLCGHEELFVPPEAWFFGELVCNLPSVGPLDKEDLDECARIILANERWKDWRCPEEKLERILGNCAGLGQAAVLDRIFRGAFDLPDGVRWGEKSPRHSYIVDRIGRLFPQSQFIHLIRDGRDVASSMLARGWFGANTRRGAEHWQSCVHGASRAAAFGPDRYMEVRFEALVENPEEQIGRICRFLKIDFDRRMLSYQDQIGKFIPSGESAYHLKLNGNLNANEVGKWKSSLSAWQEAVFWSVAGGEMRRCYPDAQARCTAGLLSPVATPCALADRLLCVAISKFPVRTRSRPN
jgi:hypothetical protein